MMRTTWGDHDRFIDTYFTMYPNIYFTGDGCRAGPGRRLLADGPH